MYDVPPGTDVAGEYTIYRTLPIITKLSTPNSGNGSGTIADPVMEFDFNVEGPAGRTGTITNIDYIETGTCSVGGEAVGIYNSATPLLTADQADGTLADTDFNNSLGIQVSSGSTKTLTLKIDGSGCAVDETLGIQIVEFDFNDDSGAFGAAPYTATGGGLGNQFLYYDLTPVPLTDSLKY